MDPNMMMLLATMISGGMAAAGGKDAQRGSNFGENQQGGIDDILRQIKEMQGSGGMDINKQPGYQQGQDYLMSMFNDPKFFEKFEAPLQRQFQEQTVPELANRFGAMGSGGATGSTAFRNQLGREGSNLSTNIGALRGGMQMNAIPQLLQYSQQPFNNMMSMYQQALGQPTQNQYQPANAGMFGDIFSSLVGGLASGYGQKAGQGMAG
jgi:hypothetical protein